MESKLKEKMAVLDIIDTMVNSLDWTIQNKNRDIADWKALEKASREAGEEIDPDNWNIRQAQAAEVWLAALDTVKKHLEKLI